MMNVNVFVLALLVSSSTSVNLEINDDCTTPNNETAKCISLADCSVLLNELENGTEEAKEFARRSQCGYDSKTEVPLVCCGTTGKHLPDFGTRSDFSDSDLDLMHSQLFADPTTCGLEKEMPRIMGGELTELYEFPWVVALEYKSKYTKANLGILCGGSLINKNYVLTAAHCVFHLDLELIRVWLGDWNITSHPRDCRTEDTTDVTECNDEVLKIGVKDKIGHPFFSRNPFKDDIALVRLEQEVLYTEYIRPICLPSANQPLPSFDTLLTVSGWGITENNTRSDVKLKVELPLVKNDVCANKRLSITDNDFCAGGQAGKDSCRGDSGGPIMRRRDQGHQPQWYLEGVVSHGIGCGKVGYAAVYTRVSKYKGWITNALNYHKQYDICTTPNQEPGYCIPFSMCKTIFNGVEKGVPSAIEFAKKSQCGSIVDPEPYVCCGSTGATTNVALPPRIAETSSTPESIVLFPDDRK